MLPKLYALTGDGGSIFSQGFIAWANAQEPSPKFKLHYDSGRSTVGICSDIMSQPKERRIALVGYSLGGNGTAWIADAMWKVDPKRAIDLIVAVDPTKNGPALSNYPIRSNVKRALLFKQVAMWSPINWFAGRGELVAAPGGPFIDTQELHADHLWLQFSSSWQIPATRAIQSLR